MPGERFIVGTSDSSQDDEISIFGESCQDITGRTISVGSHYVPGPDSCTVCLCDGGKPKWCQAVLCAAPKVILYASMHVVFKTQLTIIFCNLIGL